MKKILILVVVFMMLFTAACGKKEEEQKSSAAPAPKSSEVEEELPTPDDIMGLWIEEEPEEEDTYMAAVVDHGEVDIYEVYIDDYYDKGGYASLYFAGDLTAVKTKDGEPGFVSKVDEERRDDEGMMNYNDQITFVLKDGKLMFKESQYDEEYFVLTLFKGEADPLQQGMLNLFDIAHMEKDPLEVKGEYNVFQDYSNLFFCYVVTVTNPNKSLAMVGLSLEIKGKVNGVDTDIVSYYCPNIAAEDTIRIVSQTRIESKDVTDVVFNIKTMGNSSYIMQDEYNIPRSDSITVSNVQQKKGDLQSYTIDITNNGDEDVPFLTVCMVYRNKGELVVTNERMISDTLKAGETRTVEIYSVYKKFDFDDVEFFAVRY